MVSALGFSDEAKMSGSVALLAPSQAQGDRFARFAAEWKKQSRFMSNTAQMAMLPSYQRIIGMGLLAVPLILRELQKEPDQWFWALESITDENPVPAELAGKVKEMAGAWLVWGKHNGYIE
jgi:hypothetical protein